MTIEKIRELAFQHHLEIFGAFSPKTQDDAPAGTGTMVLFSPAEPGFWTYFQTEAERQDGRPDAMDRWSTRVLSNMARQLGGTALFPFGGPPYQPFIAWAKRTGQAWESPVGMLVHSRAGLMISIRGAIALSQRIDLPDVPLKSPCEICPAPCLSACPVGALGPQPYDVPSCHEYLETAGGYDCMSAGCRVRRVCPVSQSYGRDELQSAYHMRHFHK